MKHVQLQTYVQAMRDFWSVQQYWEYFSVYGFALKPEINRRLRKRFQAVGELRKNGYEWEAALLVHKINTKLRSALLNFFVLEYRQRVKRLQDLQVYCDLPLDHLFKLQSQLSEMRILATQVEKGDRANLSEIDLLLASTHRLLGFCIKQSTLKKEIRRIRVP